MQNSLQSTCCEKPQIKRDLDLKENRENREKGMREEKRN